MQQNKNSLKSNSTSDGILVSCCALVHILILLKIMKTKAAHDYDHDFAYDFGYDLGWSLLNTMGRYNEGN
jgi:hypothetical protein